jgi:hypothetical protein
LRMFYTLNQGEQSVVSVVNRFVCVKMNSWIC